MAKIGYIMVHMHFLNKRRLKMIRQIEMLDELVKERRDDIGRIKR